MSKMIESKIIRVFNQYKRIEIWNKDSDKCQDTFRVWLELLKVLIAQEKKGVNIEISMQNKFYKNILGYNGCGRSINSGIYTKNSRIEESTLDHVFGATQTGIFIKDNFIKNNEDIDYMVDKWLYHHLWIWMTIKVTKKEHHKDNILRNINSIDEKASLKHYKSVSPLMYGDSTI